MEKGNIVIARGNGITRAIYITYTDEDWFKGYLLSNIVEFAGSKDALLKRNMTGLPYELIAQTNIEIAMSKSQIRKILSTEKPLDFDKLTYGVTVNSSPVQRGFKDTESHDAMLLGLDFYLERAENL